MKQQYYYNNTCTILLNSFQVILTGPAIWPDLGRPVNSGTVAVNDWHHKDVNCQWHCGSQWLTSQRCQLSSWPLCVFGQLCCYSCSSYHPFVTSGLSITLVQVVGTHWLVNAVHPLGKYTQHAVFGTQRLKPMFQLFGCAEIWSVWEKKEEVQTVLLNQPHGQNNSCITISTFNLVEVFCPVKNGTGIRLHTHRVASLSIVTVGGCGVRICCLLK